MKIASAPGTWGIEPPPQPTDPPWQRIADEIAAAGFDGTELGPLGYYPTEPDRLQAALADRGLGLPAGFVMEPLSHDRAAIVAVARQTVDLVAAGGGTVLVLIDGLDRGRVQTAGRSDVAVRLDDRGWERLVGTTSIVAELAATAGLRVAFHPHAGTFVEFEDELDRLLADTEVDLCLDTGHAVYAGIDPAGLVRRYASRIGHVHLKDVDGAALRTCTGRGLGFVEAVAAGVFTPLGEGSVDLRGVALALEQIGYDGWATFEQDRTLETIDAALEESRRSLEHARSVGL
jgi:inosose dehydratase